MNAHTYTRLIYFIYKLNLSDFIILIFLDAQPHVYLCFAIYNLF